MKLKLALVSLIFPILAAAASVNTDDFEDDENYNDLPNLPQVELWECVRPEINDFEIEIPSVETSSFNWSILSFLGTFLTPYTPIKQVSPSPYEAEIASVADADLDSMASVINCDKALLKNYDVTIKKRVIQMKNMSKTTLILNHLAEIGDKSLFELFVDSNFSFILSETVTSRDFHNVIFDCIKIGSMNSLVNIMLHNKFPLNAPQAVVVASMNGSHEILQSILDQKNNLNYVWEWKSFDGGNGFMLDFGCDPFSAALFLGSLKAISENHLNCLRILVSIGVDISFKDYILLKKAASVDGCEAFKLLMTNINVINVPDSVMNEVLLLAINNKNEVLVKYLFTLDYAYVITIQNHLVSAINSSNKNLFDLIFARVSQSELNNQILSQAASVGNTEIFVSLLKGSGKELVVSALCSCIANENLQHFVTEIVKNISLTSEVIAQALLHSVKARSLSLVKLFLNNEGCVSSIIPASFIEALMTNDVEIPVEFFKKFNRNDLIKPNLISKTVSKLFEIEAWNSLKLFVKNYASFQDFPKTNFVSKIVLTDQVEIARIAAEKGVHFPKTELIKIRNEEMRTFVMHMISEDLNKSQLKKRK